MKEWDPEKCIQVEIPLEDDTPIEDSISSDVLVVGGEQVKYKAGGRVQFGVHYNDVNGILIADTSRVSELKMNQELLNRTIEEQKALEEARNRYMKPNTDSNAYLSCVDHIMKMLNRGGKL